MSLAERFKDAGGERDTKRWNKDEKSEPIDFQAHQKEKYDRLTKLTIENAELALKNQNLRVENAGLRAEISRLKQERSTNEFEPDSKEAHLQTLGIATELYDSLFPDQQLTLVRGIVKGYAQVLHPDRGGRTEEMAKINKARDALIEEIHPDYFKS